LISSEDDLVVYVGKKYVDTDYDVYPQVSIISRHTQVTPDIDLLLLNEKTNTIFGYELKLIKYHKGYKRYDYNPIYSGVGEALIYYKYGLEKVYLCIGIFFNPTIENAHKEAIRSKIKDVIDFYKYTNLQKILGLDIYEINKDEVTYRREIEIQGNLTRLPVDFDHHKELLFRKQFSYKSNLRNKIYKT